MDIGIVNDMLIEYMNESAASEILKVVEELSQKDVNFVRREFCDLYEFVSDRCEDILDNTTYQETYGDYWTSLRNKIK